MCVQIAPNMSTLSAGSATFRLLRRSTASPHTNSQVAMKYKKAWELWKKRGAKEPGFKLKTRCGMEILKNPESGGLILRIFSGEKMGAARRVNGV